MKSRSLSMLLVTSLVVTGGAAAARGDEMPRRVDKRSVGMSYRYVASSNEQPLEYHLNEPLQVDVERDERWAALLVADATGEPVGVHVTQDVDRDGTADSEWDVCGKTDRVLNIAPGRPLVIDLNAEVCQAGRPTSGKVYVDLFSPAARIPAVQSKLERTLGWSYLGAVHYTDMSVGVTGKRVELAPTERYVRVAATDATGLPVHLQIHPDNAPSVDVCGASDRAVEVEPGSEIGVTVSPLPCPDGTPVAMTAGSLEVTLSNVP